MALLKMTSKILATSNKLRFYAGRDSSCSLLLDSDISKNIVDLIDKEGGKI